MRDPTDPAWNAASGIARRLRAEGHEAYIAGGAVRDFLLGRTPHDVDVATSARPDDVVALYPDSHLVGASFGVVRVREAGEEVEVATFRTDGPYEDGRRPTHVRFATAREDVARRDFTVNGLFLDPETREVLDWVGGRADLEAGILRAIGDPAARFAEDRLRLLRAVRLAAQLDFTIHPDTLAAVRRDAPRVGEVAAERTRDELLRILTGPAPARGLTLLRDSGLLEPLLPEVAAMEGVEQDARYHPEGDVWTHTLLMFEHLESPSPELALGVLLHDIGKPPTFERAGGRIRFHGHAKLGAEMADEICRRLRLSNESREHVVAMVANHMRFIDVQRMKTSTLKRFLRLEGLDEHLALHRADCLSSHRKLENWDFVRSRREEFAEEDLRPPRLVNGRDLAERGWIPGPAMGRELARIEELQLDGKITTRAEALEAVGNPPVPEGGAEEPDAPGFDPGGRKKG